METRPRPPRRTERSGGDPGAARASSLLLGMLAVAVIGLSFAIAITLVSATD